MEQTRPNPIDNRVLEAMEKADALQVRFEREREGRVPFEMTLQCTLCSAGTITAWYREPLYGWMRCNTPGCLKQHF